MAELTRYDAWISDGGPAALVVRELLESVEGPDGVIFPATFAPEQGGSPDRFRGGYNIDVFPDESTVGEAVAAMIKDGRLKPTCELFPTSPNVCLIDSVGSQANRIEPIFAEPKFAGLVPQFSIRAGDKSIKLLEAGHRAGDAIVRFSKLGEKTWDAFQALLTAGNAEPLARVAPTSIVFGVWDSRGTQVKVPRVFRSVVRATNVRRVSRSAQFNRATKYVEEGLVREQLDVGDGDKNPLSREGMKDSPASGTHGGVIVGGEIRREIIINLTAIRRLHAGRRPAGGRESGDDLRLRRYILGLSLVAATAIFDEKFDLREGCLLRVKPGHTPQWREVPYAGEDKLLPDLTDDAALAYKL